MYKMERFCCSRCGSGSEIKINVKIQYATSENRINDEKSVDELFILL